MKQTPCYFVIYDDDKKLFNISSPVNDDTELTNLIAQEIRKGRNIHCSTTAVTAKTYDDLKKSCNDIGYRYTDNSLL